MSFADHLRETFPDLLPVRDDLFLLEAHQIASLPDRAPARQLAAVLHADSRLRRFFVMQCPDVGEFLARLLTEHGPAKAGVLETYEQTLLWEIADWIVYQRAPEMYDAAAVIDWDPAAVTGSVALDEKTVIDAGAGTGRVAFDVASIARHVYAIEPGAALRRFMRRKAVHAGVDNLYVLDGFLHAIPLPAESADVLLTCHAIGWDLPAELGEIDRVVKPGGTAMHLFGTPDAADTDSPFHEPLTAHGYRSDVYRDGDLSISRYTKRL